MFSDTIVGMAVALHGYFRWSQNSSGNPAEKFDLDIWYKPTYDNYLYCRYCSISACPMSAAAIWLQYLKSSLISWQQLRTLPLPYSQISKVWCSFVSHSTASKLSSFIEISLPFILIIFLMKGEEGASVKMGNSLKVLVEHWVCC
jgi:hypothetical protein